MSAVQISSVKGSLQLGRTDAAGVMYFAAVFEFAHEAIEQFLQSRGFAVATLLKDGPHLPVVHAKADFESPLMVGEAYSTNIEVVECGESSIAFSIRMCGSGDRTVAKVKIIHACIDPKTRRPIQVPPALRAAVMPAG